MPQIANRIAFQRMPQDDDELWYFVQALWGVRIARTKVCRDHAAPFDAFADAYFARHPVSIWKASRGFGGKSFQLSLLAHTEAVGLGAQSTILGGSGAQSLMVHEAGQQLWQWPMSPRGLLDQPPTKFGTRFNNGAWIRTLMASQTSVRGPHPQRLRLDEIDEMDLEILNAAQGQPMRDRTKGIETQTVMSSTHQYPDKTMSHQLGVAKEKGWPIYEWCWRETTNPYDGWLTNDEVMRKRQEIPQAMWDAEYDLQEPSFEGRAIDSDALEAAFLIDLGQTEADIWEADFDTQIHTTGIDWAKKKDWTVMLSFAHDQEPWTLVAARRMQRQPWPVMIHIAAEQWRKYGGRMAHDATGVGDVVSDYLKGEFHASDLRRFKDVIMSAGRARQALFSEYISAIESGQIVFPRIDWMYKEHKYATIDDLYGSGHPPDSVVAGAIAWSQRANRKKIGLPVSIGRSDSPWAM